MAEALSPPLALTKAMAQEDYDRLGPELALVEKYFDRASPQHPARRWEYALALHALHRWSAQHGAPPSQLLDVGGAGSPFHLMIPGLCEVIDPVLNCAIESFQIAPGSQDAVFSISVIEHVEHVQPFLRAIHRALAPQGLLFLTFDGTETEGDDVFAFHWMRRRIYTPSRWQKLYRDCRELGFRRFGEPDWSPHGAQVYDYTFLSLAMVKGSEPSKGAK